MNAGREAGREFSAAFSKELQPVKGTVSGEEGYAKLAKDPEWIAQSERRRRHREVMAALSKLDGSQRAAVALITGLSQEQLDSLGGFTER